MNQEKTCCGVPVQTQVQDGVTYYWCQSCGKAGKGIDAASAWKAFGESSERVTGRGNFERVAMLAQSALERKAAPFIQSDHPALDRMIKKNVEYISSLSGSGYDAVWASPEGRESLMKALEESIEIGATLPEMGSVVPYGNTAELIPDVEAFRFALTTGASSPFEWVNIEAVYENDTVHIGRQDGQFSLSFDSIPLDRGDLAGVAVYGKRRGGATEGEFFPIRTLDAMARKFSKPYQKAMRDIDDFKAAKAEGKVLTDDYGREYIPKTIKGKGDKPDWTKKVYLDEIDCPYTGPTAAKMYMKLAGKSFLGPYMKTRNSAAAIHEMQEQEAPREPAGVVRALINRTADNFVCGGPNCPPPSNPAEASDAENSPEQTAELAAPVAENAPVISAPRKEKAPVTPKGDDGLF